MSCSSHLASRIVGVLVVAALFGLPETASAAEDKAFSAAKAAFDAGKYDEALRHADAALAVSREARLVYLKARTVWKLNRFEESWSLMNAIRPNELPAELQEKFVSDYGRMEIEVKTKRKEKKKKEAMSAENKRHLIDAEKAYNSAFWMFIGAGAAGAGGAALMAIAAGNANEANDEARDDPGTHGDYHDRISSANTLYWSGVGLIVVGAGVGAWGMVKWMGAGDSKTGLNLDVQPRTWLVAGDDPMHGLTFSARF